MFLRGWGRAYRLQGPVQGSGSQACWQESCLLACNSHFLFLILFIFFFLFFILRGRYLEQRVDTKGQGNEWDRAA